MFKTFVSSEAGATLVEYGVALILAIGAGGVALVSLGGQTSTNMEAACEVLRLGGEVEGSCSTGEGDDS